MTDDEMQVSDEVQASDEAQVSDEVQANDEMQVGDDLDVDESTAGTRVSCVVCGSAIDPTEWHPVRSRIDEAGDLHIDAFCSTECRETVQSE